MSNFTNIVQFAEVGEGTLDMPVYHPGWPGGRRRVLPGGSRMTAMAVIRSIA